MSETSWTIALAPRVRKQLEHIADRVVICRIRTAIERLATSPRSGKRLIGHPRVRSQRVATSGGEYRVLYVLKQDARVVLVVLVGPRESVYSLLKRSEIGVDDQGR